MKVRGKLISYERFRTWTRFETEAKGTRKWLISMQLGTLLNDKLQENVFVLLVFN